MNEVLGRNIRKYRLSLNWTQEKLANILCISHQVISKWENGIAYPDIEILCSMVQIFNVSLDELCGIKPDNIDIIVGEIEKDIQSEKATYSFLHSKWGMIENQLMLYPNNEKLLFTALNFLRTMHDKVETDAQKNVVNAQILKISERILDFSKNDSYRSYANSYLAVYYLEQVNFYRNNESDIINAKKAKTYADLVLYKDMSKTLYHSFGASNAKEDLIEKEKTLTELINATKTACKNLINSYTHNSSNIKISDSVVTKNLKELEIFSNKLTSISQLKYTSIADK